MPGNRGKREEQGMKEEYGLYMGTRKLLGMTNRFTTLIMLFYKCLHKSKCIKLLTLHMQFIVCQLLFNDVKFLKNLIDLMSES